ncbi:MAG: crossover junction endodeoxyribonuclease RuvC [Chitinophagaceae bacterium]
MQEATKIILGIDPGTQVMGYSILQVRSRSMELIEMDAIRLTKKKDMYERLLMIHEQMQKIISQFSPTELAIEAPFFGKNVQSMLKLGRAQGIAIAVAMHRGLPVTEYSPRKIKQSITGNGNADKEQVLKMLKKILILPDKKISLDASDALAVAVCHHFQYFPGITSKSAPKGWDDFIKKNPARIS